MSHGCVGMSLATSISVCLFINLSRAHCGAHLCRYVCVRVLPLAMFNFGVQPVAHSQQLLYRAAHPEPTLSGDGRAPTLHITVFRWNFVPSSVHIAPQNSLAAIHSSTYLPSDCNYTYNDHRTNTAAVLWESLLNSHSSLLLDMCMCTVCYLCIRL